MEFKKNLEEKQQKQNSIIWTAVQNARNKSPVIYILEEKRKCFPFFQGKKGVRNQLDRAFSGPKMVQFEHKNKNNCSLLKDRKILKSIPNSILKVILICYSWDC